MAGVLVVLHALRAGRLATARRGLTLTWVKRIASDE